MLHRVTLPGGIFIAAIAVVPSIVFFFTGNTLIQAFGGTSILIMIGVALDTMSKVESQLKMHNYDASSSREASKERRTAHRRPLGPPMLVLPQVRPSCSATMLTWNDGGGAAQGWETAAMAEWKRGRA